MVMQTKLWQWVVAFMDDQINVLLHSNSTLPLLLSDLQTQPLLSVGEPVINEFSLILGYFVPLKVHNVTFR